MARTSPSGKPLKLQLTSGIAPPPPPKFDRSHGVGELLQSLRKKQGLKQADLAKALEFRSTSAYSKIEAGESSITLEQLYAVAQYLGYSVRISLEPVLQE